MSDTATEMQPDMSKLLALLSTGHTTHATAELMGWPIGRIRAIVNGQRGWMIDRHGRVYDPGQKMNRVRLPDEVDPAHLEWAREQRKDDAPRTIQFQEPAHPVAPPDPRPATVDVVQPETKIDADGSSPPATVRGSRAIDGPITTDLPLHKIHDHPANIREDLGDLTELADSIRAHGLLQPVTVHPHPELQGEWELLAGHRRRAAAVLAGLAALPSVVRYDVDASAALEIMIVENVQRQDLGPIEKAEAFGRLRDQHGYTASAIAKRTGITQSTVSYFLTLLDLAPEMRDRVRTGDLPVGDAVAMVRRYRAQQRKKTGSGQRDWTWEPDHFANTHPLAKKAKVLCDLREHTARRRIGSIACGQCWETVIRSDERVAMQADTEVQKASTR